MAEAAVGFMSRKRTIPTRGERVATATVQFMEARGLTRSELAFQAQVDKRDLERLLTRQQCGPRLEDSLELFFGWDFTEVVASALHGADPLAAREAELERQLATAAALQARIERERAARSAAPAGVGELAREPRPPQARTSRERRTFAQAAPPLRAV